MKHIDRRNFFIHLKHLIADQFSNTVKNSTELVSLDFKKNSRTEWTTIARLSEMFPEVAVYVHVADCAYLVRANNEGIWAENEVGHHVALRIFQHAHLQINPSIQWPKNRVLSQITGTEIDLPVNGD